METIYLFTPLYIGAVEDAGYSVRMSRKFGNSRLVKDEHSVTVYFDDDENGTYIDIINIAKQEDEQFVKDILKGFDLDFLCDFQMKWYMCLNNEHRTDEMLEKLISDSKKFLEK